MRLLLSTTVGVAAQVIDEFLALPESYRTVIANITNRMGNGMADFARREDKSVDSIKDYNLVRLLLCLLACL